MLDTSKPGYVIAFTALVAAGFTAAVMGVQEAFRGRIERNEAFFLQQALVRAFGLGDTETMTRDEVVRLCSRRVAAPETIADPQTGRAFEVYRAYEQDLAQGKPPPGTAPSAVAFLFRGKGFWDEIRGVIALSPDLDTVVGLAILEQKETPGLGGRITEKGFQDAFRGLDVSRPAEGERFIYVASVQPDDPRRVRSVDSITGATQTSLALDRVLNENLAAFRRAMDAARLP